MTCVHDLHLKPISQCRGEYTRDGQSIELMNSQYIIVYNKVTVKKTDYQAHS